MQGWVEHEFQMCVIRASLSRLSKGKGQRSTTVGIEVCIHFKWRVNTRENTRLTGGVGVCIHLKWFCNSFARHPIWIFLATPLLLLVILLRFPNDVMDCLRWYYARKAFWTFWKPRSNVELWSMRLRPKVNKGKVMQRPLFSYSGQFWTPADYFEKCFASSPPHHLRQSTLWGREI